MKTLVIGATGLLGLALTEKLVQQGKDVRVTIRDISPQQSKDILRRLGVEMVTADICNEKSLENAFDSVSDVYLTAAVFKTWLTDISKFERVNVEGTRNVLKMCLKKSIRRIVYTSSHGIIGLSQYPNYSDETTPILKGQFDDNPYLLSKYKAEQVVISYVKKGLDVVVVNPVGIIGINDFSNNPTNKYIKLAAEGNIPKYCVDAYTCLAGASDIALGHILAMEKGRKGERYILGGDNITFEEYFTILQQCASVNRKLIKIPLSIMLMLSYIAVWQANVTSKAPILTPASVKFLMKKTRYSCKKAVNELGYKYRPVKSIIEETYQWFKKIGVN